MAIKDLREFLSVLAERGQLADIKTELEDGYEVSALGWEMSDRGGGPAIILKVKGYDIPIVANAQGTLERNVLALGLEPKGNFKDDFLTIRNTVAKALREKDKWPKTKQITTAPCQEVVLERDKVNLYKFPILTWNKMDGGPYVTLPNVITRDPVNPDFGRNNGMYRVMLFDAQTTGIMCCATQDIGIHVARAREAGMTEIPVAIAIGNDPVINMTACTKLDSFTSDEFELAGFLRGEPTEMVTCKSIDLDVPAHAELVLEGILDINPAHARKEGPFGEWMGYFEEPMMTPVFHVKCITHRKNVYYQMCTLGHERSDGDVWKIPLLQANGYNVLKNSVIGFRDYYQPLSSRGYKAVVQIQKRFPNWGKQAIYAYLGSGQGAAAVNYVVIVDEDIDIFDSNQVDWAIATRMDPAEDVLVFPKMGVYPLNPAASLRVIQSGTGFTEFDFIGKMGIDATKKMEMENRRPTGTPVKPDVQGIKKVREKWDAYGLKNYFY
ncbi:MAG: UbiD family decarboxylase [Desulfotomaculaceae bacterium]|nr:UbiD family decarboxylase [Desulfotomaculaceae bacterium]